MLDWAKTLVAFFNVKIYRFGKQSLYKGDACIYLCNHRSWADFFIDCYLTEGRAALMSRWLVYFVFPVFCTSVILLKGIILFKRGSIADKTKFNEWIDEKRASSNIPGVIVYPEGHRSMKLKSLPLKRGMLHYAYGRKIPIQIVISRGKEAIISEKTMSVLFGSTVVFGYSSLIKPTDFEDFESFFSKIQAEWDDLWIQIYSADVGALTPHVQRREEEQTYEYDIKTRLGQLMIVLASFVALALNLLAAWWLISSFFGILLEPLKQVLIASITTWFTISFWRSHV